MTLAGWLRFAELSLFAGWLCWRLYGPGARSSGLAIVPGAAALMGAGQLLAAAQSATDPFTSLVQVLPTMLATPYGVLSAASVLLALGTAVWLLLRMPIAVVTTGLAATLLALGGAASITAADAVSAATSSGQVVMSPTLTVPRSALTAPNPFASDPQSASRGSGVYQQYCLTCHGLNGDGNGPAVAGLRVRPPTFRNPQHFLAPGMDGAHFWVVQHGDGVTGGMPAWDGTLTPQQMWDVVDYVKSIAAGRPAAPIASGPSSGSSQPGGSATPR